MLDSKLIDSNIPQIIYNYFKTKTDVVLPYIFFYNLEKHSIPKCVKNDLKANREVAL